MPIRSLLLTSVLSVFPTLGAAAPISYEIDQALWGAWNVLDTLSGIDSEAAYEVAAANRVAASPDDYAYLTGTVTLDWDNDTFLSADLRLTGFGETATYQTNDITRLEHANVGSRLSNLILPIEEFRISFDNFFGPLMEFENDTGPKDIIPQYLATLDLTISRVVPDGPLRLTMQDAALYEAQQIALTLPDDPFCSPLAGLPCPGTTSLLGGGYQSLVMGGVYTETYTGVGISQVQTAPVPLPAAGWMLMAGLGAVGAVARRRS